MNNLLTYDEMNEGAASAIAGIFHGSTPEISVGDKYVDGDNNVIIKVVNLESPIKKSILVKMYDAETGKEIPGVTVMHREEVNKGLKSGWEKYKGTPKLQPVVDSATRARFREMFGKTSHEDMTEDD